MLVETKHFKYVVGSDKVELWSKDKDIDIDPPVIRQPFQLWSDIEEWFVNHVAYLDQCKDEVAE